MPPTKLIFGVRRRATRGIVAVLGALVVASCADGGRPSAEGNTVGARLDVIEKRLAAIEARIESVAQVSVRLEALEHRVAALETAETASRSAITPLTTPAALAPTPPATPAAAADAAGPWSALPHSASAERNDQLAALREEYQSKVAELEDETDEDAARPGREQALRELNQWYKARLRTILNDEPWSAEGRSK